MEIRSRADRPAVLRRAHQLHSRATAAILAGRGLRTRELLLTEAAAVARLAPALSVSLYVDASMAATLAGEVAGALADARVAFRSARGRGHRVRAGAELAMGLALAPADPDRGTRHIHRALRALGRSGPEATLMSTVGFALMWTDQYEASRVLLEAAVAQRRETSDASLARDLDTLALLDFRTGRFASADARSAEALRIAARRRLRVQAASCHTTLARIAAVRGDDDSCRMHLASCAALGNEGLIGAYAATALALLELGADRPDAAALALERTQPPDEPVLFDWRADLIEAYIRSGRETEAAQALATLQRHADASGRRSARAVAARCRGLLAPASRIDEEFHEALRWHATLPTPFERARTELCYGERLRRIRRRGDARLPLRSALESFERLGAVPWAERARRELAATSRRAGRDPADVLSPLTRHELQVASLVGHGARNREIARALYVRERTVEYHLTNIYRKLGLRSRSDLARVLAMGQRAR